MLTNLAGPHLRSEEGRPARAGLENCQLVRGRKEEEKDEASRSPQGFTYLVEDSVAHVAWTAYNIY